METSQDNRRRPIYWLIVTLFGTKRPKNFAHGGHFSHTHTPSCTHNKSVKPSFMVPYWQLFEKMAKNLQNSNFNLFCNWRYIEDRGKKSKFYFHNFVGNIALHIYAKYRNDRVKTEGAYSIWKGWRRTSDGSAWDKLRWLCQQRS